MIQSLELNIWLGLAGIALSSAQLLLWRTRRVLNRNRQDASLSVPVPAGRLIPAAITEMATPVTSP